MAEQDLRRVFRATATLSETERACENAQMRKRVQIQNIQMGIAEMGGGIGDLEVNVVDFKKTPISQIPDDLKFFDLSTPQGATDANVAVGQGFKVLIDECQMFVEGQEKKVKVLGKKSA